VLESDLDSSLSQAFAGLSKLPEADLRRVRAQAHHAMFGHEPPGEKPLTIGRYRLLANVGRGGLGEVWAAHDVRLDRLIAVKLLRDDTLRRHRRARAQLLAEAAVMARLTHPNVVRVYDVGESDDGELFVAMEYVQGQTLRAWQRAQRHWRAILDVYLRAGEGLAAAHAAALVHGDFKPDNVLIGDDGRVLVGDFGVVQHLAEARTESTFEPESRPRTDAPELADDSVPQTILDSTVEPAVLLVGTPAYMAPEQLVGGVPDARADQFGFCVALWEALVGERPFAGRTPAELREAIADGLREPSRGSGAPAQLFALLRRGLANDPSARYSDLARLLALLRRLQSRRRRWTFTGVSLLVLGIGVFGTTYGLLIRPPISEHRACTVPELASPDWPDRRERVAVQLREGTPELPPERIATLLAGLDEFEREWGRARGQVCAMQRWFGDASVALVQQRSTCLHAALVEFAAASEVLAAAESNPVISASPLVASLPKPARCLAASDAIGPVSAPATGEPRVDRRAEIARVRALRLAQRYEDALAAADELLDVDMLAHEPAQLGALELERGLALLRRGDQIEARRKLQRAYSLAEIADDRRLALLAASEVAYAEELLEGDPYSLEAWAERTILLAERVGDPAKALEGRLLLGRALRRLGEPERALQLQIDALARAERELGPHAIELAYAHDYLGGLHAEFGHVEQALEHKREAVAILERELGPDHLDLATLLSTSANIHAMLGHREQARALWERASSIVVALLGREHRRTRALARRYANFLFDEGEPELAQALLDGDEGHDAALARARWAIATGQIEQAKQLLDSFGDPLEHEREPSLSDGAWLRGELLLVYADIALAERRFEDVRTLADGLRALARPRELAGPELAAWIVTAELELPSGSLSPATDQALARALDKPGVLPTQRARVLALRFRATGTSGPDAREQARAAALAAMQIAYGPKHPYRRAIESAQP
jgi:serine/threonine protein kinase/tetratricopeptide (TPR) repeat protein